MGCKYFTRLEFNIVLPLEFVVQLYNETSSFKDSMPKKTTRIISRNKCDISLKYRNEYFYFIKEKLTNYQLYRTTVSLDREELRELMVKYQELLKQNEELVRELSKRKAADSPNNPEK